MLLLKIFQLLYFCHFSQKIKDVKVLRLMWINCKTFRDHNCTYLYIKLIVTPFNIWHLSLQTLWSTMFLSLHSLHTVYFSTTLVVFEWTIILIKFNKSIRPSWSKLSIRYNNNLIAFHISANTFIHPVVPCRKLSQKI